ncbi:MAG: class I poly(R)-hydroxyalkanoic acid synthase [Alphaproteobacteria bacterium]|nr:class I poly(R)-hydroxyalkanoic acid synthase [Alphaproteobacteria bacterium]
MKKETPSEKQNRQKTNDNQDFKVPDPVALSNALLQAYEKSQPLFEDFCNQLGADDYIEKLYTQEIDPLNIRESYLAFLDRVTEDPTKFMRLQGNFMRDWMHLWQESTMRFMGQPGETIITPEKGDRRFNAPAWQDNVVFDFIKQSYLLTCRWMDQTVHDVDGLTPDQRDKLAFQARLFAGAMSPTNYLLTNPEVLDETVRTGGENLVRGLENLMEDMERGKGELKISTTKSGAFELGVNIAATPGRVVYQNDLIQLIQYEPKTKECFKTPLLIVSPWINKYYILDLKPENSLVSWALEQGHTVFMISWVNPGPELAQKRFEDYMEEGVLASLDNIKAITGEPDVNAIGYCLGGTLLATTMAYLATKGKKESAKIKSATFLTTLLDFAQAGDLKIFLDKAQIDVLDRIMQQKGILPGAVMHKTFSLLRANDLIWSFVVNNYLMGREPFPFDLLYWNDDYTNMPATMHSFYIRKMYYENALHKAGGITMNSVPIDLSNITTPCYFLSTREDHIAPWHATYQGTQLLKGPCTFTLAASGHVAGVINPPAKMKYCYWTGAENPAEANQWLEDAKQHEGSWWPHWQEWVTDFAGEKIKARTPAQGIEAAPGSYVKKRGASY